MKTEDNLKSVIASSRKVPEDSSIVIYDLTKSVDFSNPRKTAETLAAVFLK